MPNDVAWREKLASWMGGVNVTLKDVGKNQDDLEEWVLALQKSCHGCREELLLKVADLEAAARHAGKIWGIICGIIASVVTAILIIVVTRLMGL